MSGEACTHIEAISSVKHAKTRQCEECVKNRRPLAAPAHLPDLRRHAVLRFVAEHARIEARARLDAPGDCVGGTGRALALLLSRRRLRREY